MTDKTNFEISVEQALGLPTNSPPMVQKLPEVEVSSDVDNDFATARNNLHKIIHQGNDALEEALIVAKTSEHPRAFEVVGGLIKTLVDANKDLLDIQKKLKDLKKSDDPRETGPQTVQAQNAIFVGTSAELQQLINGRKDA
jgi:hypothetical protein